MVRWCVGGTFVYALRHATQHTPHAHRACTRTLLRDGRDLLLHCSPLRACLPFAPRRLPPHSALPRLWFCAPPLSDHLDTRIRILPVCRRLRTAHSPRTRFAGVLRAAQGTRALRHLRLARGRLRMARARATRGALRAYIGFFERARTHACAPTFTCLGPSRASTLHTPPPPHPHAHPHCWQNAPGPTPHYTTPTATTARCTRARTLPPCLPTGRAGRHGATGGRFWFGSDRQVWRDGRKFRQDWWTKLLPGYLRFWRTTFQHSLRSDLRCYPARSATCYLSPAPLVLAFSPFGLMAAMPLRHHPPTLQTPPARRRAPLNMAAWIWV